MPIQHHGPRGLCSTGAMQHHIRSPLTANGAKHSSRPVRSSAAATAPVLIQQYGPPGLCSITALRAYAAPELCSIRAYTASWPPGPMHHGRYAARGPPGRRSNTALCSTIRTQHHGLRPFTDEAPPGPDASIAAVGCTSADGPSPAVGRGTFLRRAYIGDVGSSAACDSTGARSITAGPTQHHGALQHTAIAAVHYAAG